MRFDSSNQTLERSISVITKVTNELRVDQIYLIFIIDSKMSKEKNLKMETIGTMQNRFLNLDNFFIYLAYGDLMVGISDGTNCF